MESRVKLFGHPVHPVLIVLPLGLFSAAVIFDILFLFLGIDYFPAISYWNIALGVLGGLLAAIFGLIDWLAIPGGTRAKSVGLWHGLGNVMVIVLFSISWLLRLGAQDYTPSTSALILSFAGIALSGLTGWLGGELVYRLSVSVDRGANLQAPSSLSGEHASKTTGD